MKLLLKPVVIPELGQVILRPGSDLLPMFRQRVVVDAAPSDMQDKPSGVIKLEQPLINDKRWWPFLTDERVLNAAGGKKGLIDWLKHSIGCQWTDEYHHEQPTILEYGLGAIRLCWHHDNELREKADAVQTSVEQNIAEYVVMSVRRWLYLPDGHQLTHHEISWWSVLAGVSDLLPNHVIRTGLRLPPEIFPSGTLRECDITWEQPANEMLGEQVENIKPILRLVVDEEPAAAFMLRPKLKRWECEKYTRWVKTQKCSGCGNPSDDPHHIIGHGQGGMGTKAHDFFVIPLCRNCHNALHNDPNAWEAENGSQVELLFRFLDRALGIGAIVIERKGA